MKEKDKPNVADTMKDGNEVDDQYDEFYYHHLERRRFSKRCAGIEEELDAAMGAYMAALDDPQSKSGALTRSDAGLLRLREVYREVWLRLGTLGAHPASLIQTAFRARRPPEPESRFPSSNVETA